MVAVSEMGGARERLREQMTSAGAERLWDAEDVAALLGLQVGWVYREVRENRIPHIKLGPRRVRFRREAIEQWLLERERASRPPRR